MVFEIICWVGLLFVVLALPGALRKRRGDVRFVRPFANDASPDVQSQTSPLARDRLEVLELWEKCSEDSKQPAPIPPAKPHPYFGDEKGRDVVD
ncbi:MAG TPA: hypothetical protein VFV23_07590 [Verrucomicrobiae bacterium]|nr:hypothetical protein [Verrucomicrobiae bacterium]